MNSCCTCSNYSRHFTSVFKFCSHCKQESGKETHGVYNGSNQSECSSFSIFNQLRINTETTWESNALMIKIRLEAEMNFLLPTTISLSLSQTLTSTHTHTHTLHHFHQCLLFISRGSNFSYCLDFSTLMHSSPKHLDLSLVFSSSYHQAF